MHLKEIYLFYYEKVIKITRYVQPNDTITIIKFQRSRLTFNLLANVNHIGVPAIYLNIVFSEIIRPIDLKFYIKTP